MYHCCVWRQLSTVCWPSKFERNKKSCSKIKENQPNSVQFLCSSSLINLQLDNFKHFWAISGCHCCLGPILFFIAKWLLYINHVFYQWAFLYLVNAVCLPLPLLCRTVTTVPFPLYCLPQFVCRQYFYECPTRGPYQLVYEQWAPLWTAVPAILSHSQATIQYKGYCTCDSNQYDFALLCFPFTRRLQNCVTVPGVFSAVLSGYLCVL